MDVDQLLIKMGLNTADVETGMRKAQATISNGLGSIRNAIAGVAGATAFTAMFKSVANEADNLLKLSRTLQMNIGELDAWGQAVARAGGTAESFQQSALSLTSQISMIAVKGTSRAKPFFDALGVSVTDAEGKGRDAIAVLTDISGAIEGMNKQESFGMLSKMGLDKGTINLLQEGKRGLQDLIKQQKEFGVFTKKDAEIAEKFNDSMDNLTQSLKRGFMPVVSWIAPHLTKVVTSVAKALQEFSKHTILVKAAVVMLGAAIMKALVPAFIALAKAMLANPFTWVLLLIAGVALALEDLVVWANGGKSALGGLWKHLGTPAEVKQKIDDLVNAIRDIGTTASWAKDQFVNGWQGIQDTLTELWNAFKFGVVIVGIAVLAMEAPFIALAAIIAIIVGIILDNWDAFSQGIDNVIENVKQTFQSVGDFIQDVFNSIVAAANAIISGVLSAFDTIASGITSKIGSAISTVKGWFSSLVAGAGTVAGNVRAALAGAKASQEGSGDSGGEGTPPPAPTNDFKGRNNFIGGNKNYNYNFGKVELKTAANSLRGAGIDFNKGIVQSVNTGVLG